MTDQPGNDAARTDRAPEPRISVFGVGGAGGNAINNMIRANLEGVEFIVANTDAQALQQSLCDNQIQLGARATQGLGAGARPEIGQAAAEEAIEEIANALKGSNMAFITAGMGGGTGTGGAPVIARAARDEGVLSVGVVTKPFDFEGTHRMRQAEAGIAELTQYVDTLIVIPNQNLFLVADATTTFADAFVLADDVLHSGVRGVTDLMTLPGLVNLDFADVRSIMSGMGKAVMGTGEAEGDNRALEAAEAAISNPLLDEITMSGAQSVLINITGGLDLMLMEVDEAANRIRAEVDPDANIIFGSAFSETLDGKIRVSVIATGNDIEAKDRVGPQSKGPFVTGQTEDQDKTPAAQFNADSDVAQISTPQKISLAEEGMSAVEAAGRSHDAAARFSEETLAIETPFEETPPEETPVEEPLTLRLVSTVAADDEGDDSTPSVEPTPPSPPQPTADFADEQLGEKPSHKPQASDSPSELETILGLVDETAPDDEISIPAEPTPDQPQQQHETTVEPVAKFQRPARPVKSETTLEAFESDRAQEIPTEAATDRMHYVVWEVELGARIYKVPEAKLDTVRTQPHADRLKVFDTLETAKTEANAIFKRVATQRTQRGLPRSILEPTLEDLMRWDEKNVPHYFL